jgi:hypothetical protein
VTAGAPNALRLLSIEGKERTMPAKQQTHAKRARELAVKERRERKRAKKAEAAAQRAAGSEPAIDGATPVPAAGPEDAAAESESESEWIQ